MLNDRPTYQFYDTTKSAWDAMYQAIVGARESIYWEVYMLLDDTIGRRFVEAVVAKAREGVEVKLVLDALGSFRLSANATLRLQTAGVGIVWYNPIGPSLPISKWLRRVWARNHRKVLVIDRDTAFIGGVNICQEAMEWNDVHMRYSGVPVERLLRGFAKNYVRSGGRKKDIRHLLMPGANNERSVKDIRFLLHSPFGPEKGNLLRHFYSQAILKAEKQICFLTPYYVPDRHFLKLIDMAGKRGVKIDIMVPWQSDHRFMQYMIRAFYRLTTRAGAVFHFLRTMNHGKALIVDNSLGVVGSFNLTPRSFTSNEEAGACFTDKSMIRDLSGILENWKNKSIPLQRNVFQENTLRRLLTRMAKFFHEYV